MDDNATLLIRCHPHYLLMNFAHPRDESFFQHASEDLNLSGVVCFMTHCVLYGNLHRLARSSFQSPFKLTKLKVLRGWKLLRHLPKKKHVRNLEGGMGGI